MTHLFTSNYLSTLFDQFAQQIHQKASIDQLFAPSPVVMVQNSGMQEWLKMQLAKKEGAFSHIDIRLPASVLFGLQREVLGVNNLPHTNRWFLTNRIVQLLQQNQQEPAIESLTNMWADTDEHIAEHRCWQLAKALADCFEEYELYRTDQIQAWTQTADDAQKWLMKRLFEDGGPFRHQAILQTISKLDQHADLLAPSYHVFALPNLIPHQIDLLAEIGKHRSVFFYVLHQASSSTGQQKETIRFRELLCRQAEDYLAIIQEKCSPEIQKSDSPQPNSDTHELGILRNRIAFVEDQKTLENPYDYRIHIAGTHNPMREVEVLHDWLNQLQLKDSKNALKADDILILSPKMESYRPYIDAVFGQAKGNYPRSFDYTISTSSSANTTASVVNILFELIAGRATGLQLLECLSLHAVRTYLELDDQSLTQIRNWIEDSGMRWGLDQEHRKKWNLENTHNHTLAFGLERLVLGLLLSDEQDLYHNRAPLGGRYQQSDAENLGKLLYAFRLLSEQYSQSDQKRLLSDWLTIFEPLLSSFIGETQALKIWNPLHEQAKEAKEADEHLSERPISFDIFREFVESELQKHRPANVRPKGSILCSDMIPMRSIPYRCIALLGLNESDFPRNEQRSSLSYLAQEEAKKGDRSRKLDDRFLLKECIFAAQDYLFIGYQGKNAFTNEDIPPSPLLQQLIRQLQEIRRDDDQEEIKVVTHYPLQAHNSQYKLFDPEKAPSSVEELQTTAYGRFKKLDTHDFWDALFDLELEEIKKNRTISLHEYTQRLIKPIDFFVKEQLGLSLREYELFDQEDEPFDLSTLENYALNKKFLTQPLTTHQQDASYFMAKGLSGDLLMARDLAQKVAYIQDQLASHDFTHQPKKQMDLEYDVNHQLKLLDQVPLVDGWHLFYVPTELSEKYVLDASLKNIVLSALFNGEYKGIKVISLKNKKSGEVRVDDKVVMSSENALRLLKELDHILYLSFRKALPFHLDVAKKAFNKSLSKPPAAFYPNLNSILKDLDKDNFRDELSEMILNRNRIKIWIENSIQSANKSMEYPSFMEIVKLYQNCMGAEL